MDSYINTWLAIHSGRWGALENIHCILLAVLFIVAMLITPRVSLNIRQQMTRWPVIVALGICGIAGCALLAPATLEDVEAFPSLGWGVFGLCLSCVFFGVSIITLGAKSTSRTAESSILCVLFSYGIARVLIIASGYLGLELSLASPIVITTCILLDYKAPVTGTSSAGIRNSLGALPWTYVVALIFLIFFAAYVIDAFSPSSDTLTEVFPSRVVTAFVGVTLSVAVALYLTNGGYSHNKLAIAFSLLVIVYAASLLVMFLLPMAYGVASGAKHFLDAFLWMVLACVVIDKHLNPVPVFAFYGLVDVVAKHILTFGLTHRVGLMWSILESNVAEALSAALLFALIVAAVIVLLRQYLNKAAREAEVRDEDIQALCRITTQSFGLSPRELEVVTYIYRGYSAKKIGEILGLAESTVKGNSMHAYRKMGVHSKQELIDFIDAQRQV